MSSNFLRAYVTEMSKHTDAPEIFHVGAAYTVAAAQLTRKQYRVILDGVPPRWVNLWTILTGDSGHSRKTTCVEMANALLLRVDPGQRAPDDGSPEGFLQDLMERQRDPNGGGPNTLLVLPELVYWLGAMDKQYARSFKGMLTQLYDTQPVFKRRLASKVFTLEHPRVSMLGGIAFEAVPTMTTTQDWLAGFMGRAMVIYATSTRSLPAPSTPSDEAYDGLAKSLRDTLSVWKKTRSGARKKAREAGSRDFVMPFEDTAKKEMYDVPPLPTDGNLRIALGRAPLFLQKLSAVEQVMEDPTSEVIQKSAVLRAKKLWHYWYDGMPALLDLVYARGDEDFAGDRLPRRTLRFITASGGSVRYDVAMRGVALDHSLFAKAIETLVAANLIVREKTEAGGPEMLRAVSPDEAEAFHAAADAAKAEANAGAAAGLIQFAERKRKR